MRASLLLATLLFCGCNLLTAPRADSSLSGTWEGAYAEGDSLVRWSLRMTEIEDSAAAPHLSGEAIVYWPGGRSEAFALTGRAGQSEEPPMVHLRMFQARPGSGPFDLGPPAPEAFFHGAISGDALAGEWLYRGRRAVTLRRVY